MTLRIRIAVAVCVSLAVSRAAADAPEALYIFPAGGQRGTTVEARIGGMHLFDECPLHFDATDVIAPSSIRRTKTVWFEGPVIPQPDSQRAENYPSDYAARLSIAADARLGTRWWRVSTSQGVTPSLKFVVGELPEVVEEEIDGEPIPVAVALPITINGRIFPREDIDEWSFRAAKDQTIRCEVEANRIGSPLDSQLEIVDAAGRRLAVNSDHYGADSLIVFTAPADGEYRARIFDAAYAGLQTHVYRLTISDRPHVTSVYPLGGRRGEQTEFELAGIGLSAKPQAVSIPKDAGEGFAVRFANGGTPTNEVLLETSDVAELREEEMKTLMIPCVANGRIAQPGEADAWTFDAVKGQEIEFDLHAASLGSPLDAVLTIVSTDGKELSTSDDRTATDPDPRLRYVVPTDGRYTVRVTDRSPNRGSASFAYRLHVGEAGEPSLGLTLPADALSINRGGSAKMRLQIQRGTGVDGDLKIVIDGLPEGVTFTGEKVARGRTDANLNFTAAADVPVKLHECRVRVVTQSGGDEGKDKAKDKGKPKNGKAKHAKDPDVAAAEVVAKEIEGLGRIAVARGEAFLDVLHLFTAMPTPFEVVAEFELPYAARGTSYVRRYRLERNGYEGPLEVRLAEKQMRHLQGVQGTTMTVPAGVEEFDYAVNLPTFLELGRTSRTVVTAFGEVEEGGEKHKVCFTSIKPSEQISLIIGPGPLTVAADPPAVAAAIEKPVEVAVRIDRDAATPGPVRVELLAPPHIRGVAAEPIVAGPGEEQVTLRVRFAADAGPFNMPLTVRATHGEGLKRVVAETPLEIINP